MALSSGDPSCISPQVRLPLLQARSLYSAISLELCKLEAAEEGNVWGNLMLLLPEPEPSLTGKSERASAANATKGWIKLLEGDQQDLEEVDLTGFASCLDITLTLPETATVREVSNSEAFSN